MEWREPRGPRSEKMALDESLARAALEVAFKGDGPALLRETEVAGEIPGFILPGVRRFARVVIGEPLSQIGRLADVSLIAGVDTLDDIDVVHRRFVRYQ